MRAVTALLLLLVITPAEARVRTRTVEYRQGKAVLQGYLAHDDAVKGKRPGVLVIHEWTGINDYIRRRARQLAGLGYVAFAADIYGKGVRPADPRAAAATSKIYKSDRRLMRARAAAGLAVLQRQPRVDRRRIAVIGYCFGGTTALELARSGADVAGTVSFHGGLDTPDPRDARNIKGKVLVLHGAADPHVSEKEARAFHQEMHRARVDWQMSYYGGAVHAFSNPDKGRDPKKGVAYDPRADRRSWAAMKLFFAEVLGR